MLNVPPTAKVIWRRGHGLMSHLTEFEPATPGLQGKRFIYYTTATPISYSVDIFYILVLQEYWALMESRIPLKLVPGGVIIVALSISSHEQTQ